ncbi:uncharacterized protein EV154DRAFT_431606 [Mucor mucedo]|uniref:uncharacterized protein n=1 Tax=Mucor mucedo TaxID=29922 RepID=UPI00221E6392|nr:uncharacterized protein EV154DRAFT_431606 [Mucor mucedo]KAI7871370.1 hypothetical protein EV154DRAFT_431606 [Mucor mucedo]
MSKPTLLFILSVTSIAFVKAGINVTNIDGCPALTPRVSPRSVHDLRVDDIKVVGALGDSITAGFGILSIDKSDPSLVNMLDVFKEYRGLSYSIGGEEGAFTIPNYVKHYQPNVTGYSVGVHLAESCNDQPNQDMLNAAQSGAVAKNLDHEVNYLLERIRSIEGIDFQNDWKMINIQIGSNDMCGACNTTFVNEVTPEKFGNYVEAAVEKIQKNIPRALVNLIGTFNVSQIFPLTFNQSYCGFTSNISSQTNIQECPCAATSEGLKKMTELSTAYNKELFAIYEKYEKDKSTNFTVVYQQSNLNFSGFPVDFFRYTI